MRRRGKDEDELREDFPTEPRRGLIVGVTAAVAVVAGVMFALLALRQFDPPRGPRRADLPATADLDRLGPIQQTPGSREDGLLVGPLKVPDGGWPREPQSLEQMVEVPAGRLFQGSVDDILEEDETSAGSVFISAFFIDRYEVTNEQYQECVEAGVCRAPRELPQEQFGSPRRPVVGVSWHDAATFCLWAGKRLPTEAEWERAARGDDRRTYPWGDETPTCEHAIFNQCDRYGPVEVGGRVKGASPFDCQDLAGNVWEWVHDWYAPRYYPSGADGDPQGPPAGQQRVLRGGSWHFGVQYIRSANRHRDDPQQRTPWYGFRCAYRPPPPAPQPTYQPPQIDAGPSTNQHSETFSTSKNTFGRSPDAGFPSYHTLLGHELARDDEILK